MEIYSMEAIQYLYQMYIENVRSLFRISENTDLSEVIERTYYSLDGNVYFKLILPFLFVISILLLFFIVITSALLALCCFCFLLPLFLTVFTMSLVTAYHFTISVGDHIMEAFH